jgi:hypothetical protein
MGLGMGQHCNRVCLGAAAILWSVAEGIAHADTRQVEAADLLLNACIPAVAMAKPIRDLLPAGFVPLDDKAAGALGFTGGGWSYGPPGPNRVVIGVRGERCLAMAFNLNPAATVTALESSAQNTHVTLSVSSDGPSPGQAAMHRRDYLVRAEGALPAVLSVSYPEKGGTFMGVVRPILERVDPPLVTR